MVPEFSADSGVCRLLDSSFFSAPCSSSGSCAIFSRLGVGEDGWLLEGDFDVDENSSLESVSNSLLSKHRSNLSLFRENVGCRRVLPLPCVPSDPIVPLEDGML